MVLVDTASWIELLRANGRPDVQDRLRSLLKTGQAAWCPVIRLELWRGAGNDRDLRQLMELEAYITVLEINEAVWNESVMLARYAKSKGLTIPTTMLMIAACAKVHGVEIDSIDPHFQQLAKVR